ncbi:IS66 family insertion sequence element accessory protein TnpB [Chondromyces apiculatus]|uniref:Transposase n=1 Tax=Chondromyces apiculatus DSM 436 TaxID=1192034 RepID=A0A017SWE7_9BACT|nr:IS66 family insertion sequence element accessory protein TnpB [Chondromyces apiculatus]EYF01313.1 Transposase [Chondromyces apiculatus DSM 436]
MRIPFWARTGYCIVAKRLAQGHFHLGRKLSTGATHVEVEAAELTLMLEGLDLSAAVQRKRWRLPVAGKNSASIEGLCTRTGRLQRAR